MSKEGINKTKDVKSRNWALVLYPESLKDNWKDILNEYQICWACSPLHQFDVNPDGEIKKAHYHVVLAFESNKSYSQICDISMRLSSDPEGRFVHPQVCLSLRGAVRYFTHMDNPEKYQYNFEDIFSHGLDVNELVKATISEAHRSIRDILQFCKKNNITEYADLLEYCAESNADWFDLLLERYTLVLNSYLSSARGRAKITKS